MRPKNIFISVHLSMRVCVSVCLSVAQPGLNLLSRTYVHCMARVVTSSSGGGRGEGGKKVRKERSLIIDTRRSAIPISDTLPHKRKKN